MLIHRFVWQIFCFLCAKGAVLQTGKCPLCRSPVAMTFFNNPQTVLVQTNQLKFATFEGQFHWFYEGRNGWWLYDSRTSQDIEDEFQKKVPSCELMIAGSMYVIDFENMLQYRKDAPSKTRKIKRDSLDPNTKGVAGLRARIEVGQ